MTPGEVAYDAYMRVHTGLSLAQPVYWDYRRLYPTEHAAWEAAAQAVRAMQEPVPTKTPEQVMDELRSLVGKYYAGVDVDAFMAAIRGEEEPHA